MTTSKDKTLLIKFESKSNRVKAVAFHPVRPWILSSLHSGCIQLWDYRMEVLIDKFEEHEGPVRGVHFHSSQPLFVSGGDDYKIKIWNYQLKRCIFSLLGHLDYIRTVKFHHENPWILSSSDDQTIRIWNWQSRTCLSIMTGHNHYVMCAQFHPREDLIVSASLDQTVRVWDISGLCKKSVSIVSSAEPMGGKDLFGGGDVVVKHVLEGHTRGVNWASFHPTMPLIVSCADDREVKLWRTNEAKAWEVDTMRGHINNVSCVLFHPKRELIISNSEDKSIRVWDISKQNPPLAIRREAERYWILDSHPNLNLLAAGHDSGMMVFKLYRERPAFDVAGNSMFYYKDQYVYEHNFKTQRDTPVLSTRRRQGNVNGAGKTAQPCALLYNKSNHQQHCILLVSDDSTYELYIFNKATGGKQQEEMQQAMKGSARAVVWVSRNRFAVLDKSRQIWLKNLTNESKRKVTLPNNAFISYIFPAGIGRLLLRAGDSMMLFDIQSMKVLAELRVQSRFPLKYVQWSDDGKYCAMFSKFNIIVTNSRLEELCSVTEQSRVKSGAWDACGVFVYATVTHVKYLLTNGETSIIRCLDNPIYVTAVNSTHVAYLNRELSTGQVQIDSTEYQFKVALLMRRNREVLALMKSKKLVGQSIITYLHDHGFPEVALHFVEDLNVKFSLALECGNIAVALECATSLDNMQCWHQLGVEALRQGNHQVVEAAYQRTKNFERLSFLYLIMGNTTKLKKMMQIATLRQDVMGRFHNSLYLGDIQERISLLRECGQVQLAYLTAKQHGLLELAEALAQEVEGGVTVDWSKIKPGSLLLPPVPLMVEGNWPMLEVSKGFFDRLDEAPVQEEEDAAAGQGASTAEGGGEDDILGWGEDTEATSAADVSVSVDAEVGGGWGDTDDLGDFGLGGDEAAGEAEDLSGLAPDSSFFLMPTNGPSAQTQWSQSSLAAEMVAAGAFDLAMHLLSRQLGVVDFAPLQEEFMRIYSASQCLLTQLPSTPALFTSIQKAGSQPGKSQPELGLKLSYAVETLKGAYAMVTAGKFTEALKAFRSILTTLPLLVADSAQQEKEALELITIAQGYITAMRVELARKAADADPKRAAELSAYFTSCNIQPVHQILGLRVAIKSNFTIKNFKVTAGFCRRILEIVLSSKNANIAKLMPPAQTTQIKGVLKKCETENTDEAPIDYDTTQAFRMCCESFTLIPKGQGVTCPYCKSLYQNSLDGTLCQTCLMGKVGAEGSGLKIFSADK